MTIQQLKKRLPKSDSNKGLWILGLTPLALTIIAALTGVGLLNIVALLVAFSYFYYDGKRDGVVQYRRNLSKLREYRKGIVAARAAQKAVYGAMKALGAYNDDAAVVIYNTMFNEFMDSDPSRDAKLGYKRVVDRWLERANQEKLRKEKE